MCSSDLSNYSRYKSETYEDLLNRAAKTADPKARADLLQQAEAVLIADQPIIPLYTGMQRELISPRVRGWQPNPSAIHLSRFLSIDPATPARQ